MHQGSISTTNANSGSIKLNKFTCHSTRNNQQKQSYFGAKSTNNNNNSAEEGQPQNEQLVEMEEDSSLSRKDNQN